MSSCLLKHGFVLGSEFFLEVLAIFKDLEERSNVVSEKAVELVEHLVPAEEQLGGRAVGPERSISRYKSL